MMDRSGQNLGVYRLIRLLGRGGFAEVYLGQHIHLNTQVAIKILPITQLSNQMEIESFRREAQTIAALNHPNIVRVLDFNIEQGIPFFVMEYAARGSLRAFYPRGTRLALAVLLSYVCQLASALQYVHDQKRIHRDLKPENILLRDDGSIMLSDFSIATVAHRSISQSPQNIVGSVSYIAPEQLDGKPCPASDQYSLAILVYEWACGEPPFRGSFSEVITQHVLNDPQPLRERAPDIPLAVEQVIMKALAKDPKERYSTISDFAYALEQAIQPVLSTAKNLSDIVDLSALSHKKKTLAPTQMNSSPASAGDLNTSAHEKPGAKSPDDRLRVWRFSKYEILPTIMGILLFTVLDNLLVLLSFTPSGGRANILWFLPALVIPLFVGVVYGPWAGLISGGLGYWLGVRTLLALPWPVKGYGMIGTVRLAILPSIWYFAVAFCSLGFVAGFARFFARGPDPFFRRLYTAEFFSVLAILLAFFIAFNAFWPLLYPYETVWLDFTHIALPNIALVLFLLPILLTMHHALKKVWKRNRWLKSV